MLCISPPSWAAPDAGGRRQQHQTPEGLEVGVRFNWSSICVCVCAKSRTRLKRLGIAQGTKQTVSADFSSDLGRNCHRGGQTPEVGRPTRSVQSILVHANGQKSECPFLTPVLGRGGESWQGQKMRQENDSDALLMNYCCEQCNPLIPAILIPACASSSPAFLMMYTAYKLNKQDDNMEAHSQHAGE